MPTLTLPADQLANLIDQYAGETPVAVNELRTKIIGLKAAIVLSKKQLTEQFAKVPDNLIDTATKAQLIKDKAAAQEQLLLDCEKLAIYYMKKLPSQRKRGRKHKVKTVLGVKSIDDISLYQDIALLNTTITFATTAVIDPRQLDQGSFNQHIEAINTQIKAVEKTHGTSNENFLWGCILTGIGVITTLTSMAIFIGLSITGVGVIPAMIIDSILTPLGVGATLVGAATIATHYDRLGYADKAEKHQSLLAQTQGLFNNTDHDIKKSKSLVNDANTGPTLDELLCKYKNKNDKQTLIWMLQDLRELKAAIAENERQLEDRFITEVPDQLLTETQQQTLLKNKLAAQYKHYQDCEEMAKFILTDLTAFQSDGNPKKKSFLSKTFEKSNKAVPTTQIMLKDAELLSKTMQYSKQIIGNNGAISTNLQNGLVAHKKAIEENLAKNPKDEAHRKKRLLWGKILLGFGLAGIYTFGILGNGLVWSGFGAPAGVPLLIAMIACSGIAATGLGIIHKYADEHTPTRKKQLTMVSALETINAPPPQTKRK